MEIISVEMHGLSSFREFYIDINDVDELDRIEEVMKKALKNKGYDVSN